MVTVRGTSAVKAYIADTPKKMASVLRGAAKAGAAVIADEAKSRVASDEVRDGIATKVTADGSRSVAKVFVKPGWARSVGIWLEYGTAPHFITVDDSQRGGMSVNRINTKTKEGTLVIGGQFVGKTVHHPGAHPHPFLRVSLDIKGAEAIATAQTYINSRIGAAGVTGGGEPEGEDA